VSDVIVFARGGANWRAPVIDPTPAPGSEVFVPAEDPNVKKTEYLSLFGAVAQILVSTIAIIVVVRR
jgi:hypothetical protein